MRGPYRVERWTPDIGGWMEIDVADEAGNSLCEKAQSFAAKYQLHTRVIKVAIVCDHGKEFHE